MEEIKFIPSTRGGEILLYRGNGFRINKTIKNKEYWKCTDYSSGCRSTITLIDRIFHKFSGEHNHADNEAVIRFKFEVKETLKRKIADDPLEGISKIAKIVRAEKAAQATEEDKSNLPSQRSLEAAAYRAKSSLIPKMPHQRSELILLDEWRKTLDGSDFLLIDIGEEDKIIVFGTIKDLQSLCNCKCVFMDGTFHSSPSIFTQVYILHGFIMNQMIPLLWALLPNKSAVTYRRLFESIQAKAEDFLMRFNPVAFQVDFEQAVIGTIRELFPEARIRGCFFHYSQCIYRKIQEIGLSVQYKENGSDVRNFVKRFQALALCPLAFIDEAGELILAERPNLPRIDEFVNYMDRTGLNADNALYPRAFWNHFDHDGPRTTNNLEGYHHCLNKTFTKPHPNIFKFIQVIKKEHQAFSLIIEMLARGQKKKPPSSKKKYLQIHEEIREMKQLFMAGELDLMQFIDNIKWKTPL